MKRSSLIAILIVAWLPVCSHAQSTAGGKDNVSHYTFGTLNSGGSIATTGAQLAKGKAKRILQMQLTLSLSDSSAVPSVFVIVSVNGVRTLPGIMHQQCPATSSRCTMTGTFWMDIDAMEAAHPDEFVGEPLDIVVDGGNDVFGGSGLFYEVTLSAQLVKK